MFFLFKKFIHQKVNGGWARPFHTMASTVFTVDCASPVSDKFFELADFVEYLQKHMKVGKLRNNLANKVQIESDANEKQVKVTASVKYSKRAVRYYTRKFLKKQNLRDRFRVIATGATSYELRPYRVATE